MSLYARTIAAAAAAATMLLTAAHTRYAIAANGFASLQARPPATAAVSGDRLVCDNSTDAPQLVVWNGALPADGVRLQARMANKHNNPRHTYAVTATRPDGGTRRRRIDAPQWGLCITDEQGTQWLLAAQCLSSSINDDLNDERSMTVTLTRRGRDGQDEVLATKRLTQGVDLFDGLNSFQMAIDAGTLTAGAGNVELTELFAVPVTVHPPLQAACWIGGGAKVEIERCVVACDHSPDLAPARQWTVGELDDYFATSADPVEGFWRYQDRDVDDSRLRLGGRYTLAVVAQGEGYELIYIDGAETRRSQWTAGMLKGRITPTIFGNNYDLMWVDATGQPITQDAYATVENGVLLTLKFPVYASQVRLSKILHP